MESINHRLALHICPPSVPLPSPFATPLLSSYSSIYFHFPYPFHPLSTPLLSTFKSKKTHIYWLSYATYKIKINLQFLNITNNTNSVCQSKSSFSNLMKILFLQVDKNGVHKSPPEIPYIFTFSSTPILFCNSTIILLQLHLFPLHIPFLYILCSIYIHL